jgi:hypothetical protein
MRLILAVAVTGVLTACSTGTSSPTASTPSTSLTSSSAGASASPSDAAALVALPESALAPIPGLDYAAVPGAGSDAAQAQSFLSHTADPAKAAAMLSGFLSREITYKGQAVGGIELIRLRRALSASDADAVVEGLLGEFGQATPTASNVGTQRVWQVDGARGTKLGAVAWIAHNDIGLVYSSGLADTRKIVAAHLQAA